MKILKNKYFILGNIVLILLIIPITLYLISRNQANKSNAAPTTVLSIVDSTTNQAAINATRGTQFNVDVSVNPGQNLVSIVDMYIQYDATKLNLVKITPNKDAFPITLRGPVQSSGAVNISLNIGADITREITTPTKVATLTFTPLATTPSGATVVSFDNNTSRVFSLANECPPGQNDPSGCPGVNVLQSTQPANITIAESTGVSPTPTEITHLSPTPTEITHLSPTPTPTSAPLITSVPTPTPTLISALSPTPSGPNQLPICTGLSVDRAPNGTAPFSISFTANGNDPDGTVQKVSFNFGDGPVQDVTQTGGIGSASVSVQVSHTYNSPGTYQAIAILTDNQNGVNSSSAVCTKTITVTQAIAGSGSSGGSGGASGGSGGSGAVGAVSTSAPKPTLAATGNSTTTIGIIGGIILTIIGGAVLLLF